MVEQWRTMPVHHAKMRAVNHPKNAASALCTLFRSSLWIALLSLSVLALSSNAQAQGHDEDEALPTHSPEPVAQRGPAKKSESGAEYTEYVKVRAPATSIARGKAYVAIGIPAVIKVNPNADPVATKPHTDLAEVFIPFDRPRGEQPAYLKYYPPRTGLSYR